MPRARSCETHSACYCWSVDPETFNRGASFAAKYLADATRLGAAIETAQHAECSTSAQRVRVIFPAYGLGGSILDHLIRLLPVWRSHLLGTTEQPSIAVVGYETFKAQESPTAYLWAAFDDSLPCDSWYGCYWEELARQCADVKVHAARTEKLAYKAAPFERQWGSVLFAAALLQTWWRPRPALQEQIGQAVGLIFSSGDAAAPSSGSLRCLALHVRRGDACRTKWRACPPLESYLGVARTLARRFRLTTLFVASDDEHVIEALRETQTTEPWSHVTWQTYDRSPFNASGPRVALPGGTRSWVDQRLRRSYRGERPLGRKPILEFLVDIEAASHCSALVGTMDSHGSRLMLLRMAHRLGAVPPFHSLVAPSCPLTEIADKGVRHDCENHTLARDAKEGAAIGCEGYR